MPDSDRTVPSERTVRSHLTELLSAPAFLRSPTMARLLDYLVNEELAGQGERLRGYKVGVEALNKSEDFDPSVDAGVRVETARLRKMLAAYYDEHHCTVTIEIPKGSYRPRFQQLPGAARTKPDKPPSKGASIAIAPFGTLTGGDAEQLIATGLRFELLAELHRYREFRFVDAAGIQPENQLESLCHEQLNCEFIIRCTVQVNGNEAVIHADLIELPNRRLVWHQRMSFELDHLDARELAHEIAQKLAQPTGVLAIEAVKNRMTLSPDDWNYWDCILRWHLYRLRDRTRTNHAAIRERVRQLVTADPGFAYGYLMYAMLKLDEVVYRLNPEDNEQVTLKRVRFLIEHSISIDPDNAFAHYVKAQGHYFLKETELFRESVDNAITLNPRNSDLLQNCGLFLGLAGDWATANALMNQSNTRYSVGIAYRMGHLLSEYFTGDDPQDGLRLLESTYIPQDLSVAHLVCCLTQLRAENQQAASRHLIKAYEIERVLSRDLERLVDLWFLDKTAADHVYRELAGLRANLGKVIPIR